MTTSDVKDSVQRNIRNQYFAVISANLISISVGCMLGWGSPAFPILASDDTPILSGPLTNEEISWIGSTDGLGAILGSLSFGYCAYVIGPKRTLLFLTVPSTLLFWFLIYIGNSFYHILIAKFIGGITGGGVISTVILFVSEVADDDVRGRLGSFFLCCRNIGTLIGYMLGVYVDYKYIPWISNIIPIIFFVLFSLIPNTPRYFLSRGKTAEAENALKYYKGFKGNDPVEDKAFLQEFERLKSVVSEQKKCESIGLADICNRSTIKGFFIGMMVVLMTTITCCFTIVSYAVITFAKAGKSIDPYTSMISMGVVLCLGSITSTYLADKLGRRRLNLISLLGSAVGLLITALHHYLVAIGYTLSAFGWVPLAGLSLTIYISSAGIIPLSGICCIEYLPTKVRRSQDNLKFGRENFYNSMSIILSISSLVVFTSLKVYPILLEAMDLHGCLSIYAAGTIIGFVFVFIFLKETSGTSLDDVGHEKTKDDCPKV